MSELKNRIDDIKQLRKVIAKQEKELIKEAIKTAFDTHPEVEKISWVQYTPYFNDGERCYFGVHYQDAEINDKSEYDDYDDFESEGLDKCKTTIIDLFENIDSSAFEQFGEGRVDARRDREILVENYDHD